MNPIDPLMQHELFAIAQRIGRATFIPYAPALRDLYEAVVYAGRPNGADNYYARSACSCLVSALASLRELHVHPAITAQVESLALRLWHDTLGFKAELPKRGYGVHTHKEGEPAPETTP